MGISRFLTRTGKGIYKLSKATNIVGVSVLAMMMLFTVTDVCLRYFFNRIQLQAREVSIIRGICRQVDWYGRKRYDDGLKTETQRTPIENKRPKSE